MTIGDLRNRRRRMPRIERIDLAEARAQESLGKSADSGRPQPGGGQSRGARDARARGARRPLESVALMDLATRPARSRRRNRSRPGPSRGRHERHRGALEQTARILERSGDLDGASRLYHRALEAHRTIADQKQRGPRSRSQCTLVRKQGPPATIKGLPKRP